MRISDWSSDVCSSDLLDALPEDLRTILTEQMQELEKNLLAKMPQRDAGNQKDASAGGMNISRISDADYAAAREIAKTVEIGRASCRERVGQDVDVSVGAVALKKKIYRNKIKHK